MNWIKLLLWLMMSLSFRQAISQDSLSVTFKLTSFALKEDQTVFIAGSTGQLGNWNPGMKPMEKKGNHTWIKTIVIASPTLIEYKYTLGSWEMEGAGIDGRALPNFKSHILTDTILYDAVEAWTGTRNQQENKFPVAGTVHLFPSMKGKGIRERNVIVWLPDGYETDLKKTYPVIYMHDGQNVFDAATSAFGTEWRVDEAIDSLVRAGEMEPIIAVGIYNTPDRTAEYTPGDTANAYMEFVVGRLKPFIDSAYRTKQGREHTLTGGSSAGGLIAFMLAWEHPGVFSKAICMSPAFRISFIDYVKEIAGSPKKKEELFFYIYNGGLELETKLQPGVLEMIEELKAKGFKQDLDFVFRHDPGGTHQESSWAKQFPEAIRACMWKIEK